MKWIVHLEGGPRRVNHAAVAINDRIYSFGGYCTGEDYETTTPMDVHVLDTMSFRWRVQPVTIKPSTTMDVSIPYQRYGHSAVAFEENAYIWGGRNDRNGACNVLFQLNTERNQWQRVDTEGNIPGARDGHTACVINKKMYLFGGYEDAVDRFSDEIFHYEFATRTWTYVRVEGIPAKWRDFHTAIGIGNIMYVFGGRSDVGGDVFTNREIYYNKIQTFDTVTKRWHEPGIPAKWRDFHTAIGIGNIMYVFGGRSDVGGDVFTNREIYYNKIQTFDTVTKRWHKLVTECTATDYKIKGIPAKWRDFHTAIGIGNIMYVFGGRSDVGGDVFTNREIYYNKIQTFDTVTKRWHKPGIPAKWRDFHTAIGIGNIMYVFGGRSDVGGDVFTNREIYYNKIQTFDTVTKRWHEPVTEGTLPVGRRSHSAFIYEGCMYIFGGFNGLKRQHFDEIFKFDPVTNKWSQIRPNGEWPCARRRQCCCLVNNRVFLFGGTSPVLDESSVGEHDEETSLMDRSDLHVLHLEQSTHNIGFYKISLLSTKINPVLDESSVGEHDEETSLMDHSDLHVLDLEPSLKTLAQLVVLKYNLDVTLLPKDLRYELGAMTTPNNISRPINSNG